MSLPVAFSTDLPRAPLTLNLVGMWLQYVALCLLVVCYARAAGSSPSCPTCDYIQYIYSYTYTHTYAHMHTHTLLFHALSIKDIGQDLETMLHSDRFGLAYNSSPFCPVFYYRTHTHTLLLYALSIKDVRQGLETMLHSDRLGLAYNSLPFHPIFHYLLPVGQSYQVPADHAHRRTATYTHSHIHAYC